MRLADLARELAVHPAHLARAFRGQFGTSVGGYVRRLRLDWAAAELERSDTALAAIALAAGFADQSHFTRIFRRLHRVHPERIPADPAGLSAASGAERQGCG